MIGVLLRICPANEVYCSSEVVNGSRLEVTQSWKIFGFNSKFLPSLREVSKGILNTVVKLKI